MWQIGNLDYKEEIRDGFGSLLACQSELKIGIVFNFEVGISQLYYKKIFVGF